MEPKKSTIMRQKMVFKINSVDDEQYIIRGVFSTSGEDRQGEIVDQNGWKLDEFLANPVILLFHDHYEFPVAQCIELNVDGNGNLAGAIKFAVEEYEVAKTAFLLYKGRFMRAFSVGFRNEVYEIDNEKDTVILKENTLYEISCVNVPANAMALAYSKGIDCAPLEKLMTKEKKVEKKEEKTDEQKAKDAVDLLLKIDKETSRPAIKALTEALNADGADNQVVKKVEHPEKTGGKKEISVKLINRAIRELLVLKKSK
jgi:HK97 family phage prohead protease